MGDEFRIEAFDSEGTHVVRLAGELDLTCARTVADAIPKVTGASVVVDMSELTFIDSAGITALLRARQQVQVQGDQIEFRGAVGNVRRVFGILGMEDWLTE